MISLCASLDVCVHDVMSSVCVSVSFCVVVALEQDSDHQVKKTFLSVFLSAFFVGTVGVATVAAIVGKRGACTWATPLISLSMWSRYQQKPEKPLLCLYSFLA